MDRREFLKAMGLGTAAVAVNASLITQTLAQAPPGSFHPTIDGRDPLAHMVSRLTFGITPELYRHVRAIGVEAFLEEQLTPEGIDDSLTDELLTEFPILQMTNAEVFDRYRGMNGQIIQQLIAGTIVRARVSQRQLFERMVHFWTDHFNIYLLKGPTTILKPTDDRDVIRKHALGKFRDLLGASAKSPAMLVYLDNAQSEQSAPNENYARELLELHTLGVNGGYTEEDVKEVARAFTGWSIALPRGDGDVGEPGTFLFRPFAHDWNPKNILGHTIEADGVHEGEKVLDILASHPSTARFISTKLVRHFVADLPPEDLVEQCNQTYLETDGDIKSMLRIIFQSAAFWSAAPKFKRPFEHVIGVLRALDFQVNRERQFGRGLSELLTALGHLPFFWPAPNGYPEVGAYWMNNLLPRWNLAMNAVQGNAGGFPNYEAIEQLMIDEGIYDEGGNRIMFIVRYLLGRELTEDERAIVAQFAEAVTGSDQDKGLATLSLIMASPAYQYK